MNNTQLVPVQQPQQAEISPQLRMIERAIEKGASFEVVDKLYQLHEKHEAAQAKKAFHAAMSVFQGCVQMAHKSASASFRTKNGGQMGYSFASLDDVIKVARPALQKSVLSYNFKVKQEPGTTKKWNDGAKRFIDAETTIVTVCCTISHGDGHSESCSLTSPLEDSGQKNALQQLGSTISYLRRYTLCSALGIGTSDDLDDGHFFTPEAQGGVVVEEIGYRKHLDKMLDEKEAQSKGSKEKRLAFMSAKCDRKIMTVNDLNTDEARAFYEMSINAS